MFFYYAGHGILKGHTKAVCNQGDVPRKVFYPLEGNLRALGAVPGAYVVGVFDCCRAAFDQPDRGTGVQADPELDTDEARNCILIFGCPPLGTVSAVSTVALEFIEKLEASALPDGSIRFPTMDFFRWTPGDDGETVPNFKEDLELRPPNGQSVADNPLVE